MNQVQLESVGDSPLRISTRDLPDGLYQIYIKQKDERMLSKKLVIAKR